MRIIFTGQTGTKKKGVIKALKKEIVKHHSASYPQGLDSPDLRRFVADYNVEDGFRSTTLMSWLESSNQREKERIWKESLEEILEQREKENPCHSFLTLHLTFQRKSRIFSPLSWDGTQELIKQFQPDYCVTLIDDLYSIWNRIAIGSYLRLREIMIWRNVETLMTDILAKQTIPVDQPTEFHKYPYKRSPVVSIKHPPEMLYKLLFEPESLKIYASFPITRTRDDPKKRAEIDNFRKMLHKNFVVFDPLTIDELPLERLLKEYRRQHPRTNLANVFLDLPAKYRWPILKPVLYSEDNYSVKRLNALEIYEIVSKEKCKKSEVERSVQLRDFRFIDQADCVVVYRPLYKSGEPSRGVTGETIYAQDNAFREVYFIHNFAEDGDIKGPFSIEMPYRHERIKNLIEHLKKRKKD